MRLNVPSVSVRLARGASPAGAGGVVPQAGAVELANWTVLPATGALPAVTVPKRCALERIAGVHPQRGSEQAVMNAADAMTIARSLEFKLVILGSLANGLRLSCGAKPNRRSRVHR